MHGVSEGSILPFPAWHRHKKPPVSFNNFQAWVEQAITPNRHELGFVQGKHYSGGCDATGLGSGPGADAFTVSICHREEDRVVQDVCKGWKKSRQSSVDLEGIVNEIAGILKRYHLTEVHGDKYSAQWVVEAFKRAGIVYPPDDGGQEPLLFGNGAVIRAGQDRDLR